MGDGRGNLEAFRRRQRVIAGVANSIRLSGVNLISSAHQLSLCDYVVFSPLKWGQEWHLSHQVVLRIKVDDG